MKTIEDALRDGCEAVGIQHTVPADGWQCYIVGDTTEHWMGPCHPALPAYVASLLVAKCCETDEGKRLWRWKFDEISDPNFVHEIWERDVATAQQRILAALVALEVWTLDEAKEALKP